jgi:hypothetical protein
MDMVPLLSARPLGVLEADEVARVDAHVKDCLDCRGLAADLAGELATTEELAQEKAPETAWDRISSRIELERAGRRAQAGVLPVKVTLACTFCHDALVRTDAVYCAACLAPHHGDCFERHGRCSAPGCSETRSVEARDAAPAVAARPRPRWLRPILVLAFGGALGAAALTANGLRATTARRDTLEELVGRELDRVTPSYPWAELPVGPSTKKLGQERITFNFVATPLGEVVGFLQDMTGVRINVDPSVDKDQVKIDLRLKDVIVWNALQIIMKQAGLGFAIENDGVWIAPIDALPAKTRFPRDLDPVAIFGGESEESSDVRRRLERQSVSVNFDGTPFAEAVDTLRDVTSLPFVVATSATDLIDNEQLKVSYRARDVRLQDALADICRSQAITWTVKNGVILFLLRSSVPDSVAAVDTTRVTLALRGATVPELVAALEARNIDVIASPEAWSSRGTFSLVADDEPLASFAETIGSWTPLRAWLVPREEGASVLAIGSTVPGTSDALLARAPEGFPAVKAELADLRRRLGSEVAARSAARADRGLPPGELRDRERAVDLSTAAILSLTRRATAVVGARDRLPGTVQALDKLSAQEAETRAKLKAESVAAKSRTEALTATAEAAAARVKLLGDKIVVRKKEFEATSAKLAPGPALEKLKADEGEASRVANDVLLAAIKEQDAAEKAQVADTRETTITLTRIENEEKRLRLRRDELAAARGAVEIDEAVLRRLERGERLADAEAAVQAEAVRRAPKKP